MTLVRNAFAPGQPMITLPTSPRRVKESSLAGIRPGSGAARGVTRGPQRCLCLH